MSSGSSEKVGPQGLTSQNSAPLLRSSERKDARRETIHEISRELQELAEIGKWHDDAKWDLREYFKMKKLP